MCVCERVQEVLRTKEGMCSERDQGKRAKKGVKVFANVSAGADTKANDPGAAAHFRWVIFVLLRTAASAVAPLSPIPVQ